MDVVGINFCFLFIQIIVVLVLIGLPIISFIDLAKRKMPGTPVAIWVLILCAIPVLGSLAYWIIKPTLEQGVGQL